MKLSTISCVSFKTTVIIFYFKKRLPPVLNEGIISKMNEIHLNLPTAPFNVQFLNKDCFAANWAVFLTQ